MTAWAAGSLYGGLRLAEGGTTPSGSLTTAIGPHMLISANKLVCHASHSSWPTQIHVLVS